MTETKTKDIELPTVNAGVSLPPPDPPLDLAKYLRTDDK